MDLSIVIPLLDEEDSVGPLAGSITEAMRVSAVAWEVVLVDDGSTDNTFERIRHIAERDARFRVVKLTKNFGQTAGLKAGIEAARGRVIVTMDGDLQNDPGDIPLLLAKIDEGYDMVAGWRQDRHDRLISRKIPSRVANWLIRKSMGTSIKDNGCALRAYRADVIRTYPLYSEMHRLLPTIMSLNGARIVEMPVRHHARKFGDSKYGLSRTYKVLLDLISVKAVLTFHRSPLFGFGFMAVLLAAIGIAFLAVGLFQMIDTTPTDTVLVYPAAGVLLVSLSIFFGAMGILCDMIYTTGDVRVTRRAMRHTPGHAR